MKKIFEQISINIYISYIHKYLHNFMHRVCSINFTYYNIDDIIINNRIFLIQLKRSKKFYLFLHYTLYNILIIISSNCTIIVKRERRNHSSVVILKIYSRCTRFTISKNTFDKVTEIFVILVNFSF